MLNTMNRIRYSLAALAVFVWWSAALPVANGGVPCPKLHNALADAAQFYASWRAHSSASRIHAMAAYARDHRLTVAGEKVLVEVMLADTSAAYIASLAKHGVARDRSFGRVNRRMQAFVSLGSLTALATEARVNWVQPPSRPHADVTSEGVAKTFANTYQTHAPAYDGTGVKVAIIDLGFQGYTGKLGTELPAVVTAKSFRADLDITGGGEAHGTACAEVVHDMAPGAQLYLLNFSTVVELNNAVNYCITNGIKVISHSIGWTNVSFYDGTGDLKTIVDNATTAGIVWCNSSGNQQQRHWDGTFSDPDANSWHNFSGADEDININLTAGSACSLMLTWDQWPAATTDFDFYLYRDVSGSLVQVASSTNTQSGTQPPDEEIDYTPTQSGLYHIKIKKKNGLGNTRLALFCYEYNFAEYNVQARSMLDPSPVVNAFAVGAVYVGSDVIESFSSLGPTEDGRSKPEISAPDGNANSVYGSFYGTSSACPHTAGAAALLINEDGARTVTQIKNLLTANALDLGAAGTDYSYGAGRLRMPDITAPSNPVVTSSTHTISTWSNNPAVTVTWPASTDSWSGVAGYSYLWDHTSNTAPDNVIESTLNTQTSTLGDAANWYFHVRAVDSAGNVSAAAHFGPLKIDATTPLLPVLLTTNPSVNAWSNRDTIKASWSDSDATSGMKGYVALVDHSVATNVTTGLVAPAASIARAVIDGVWYVHVAGSDSAGNWSATLHIGPFRLDHTAPTAPVLDLATIMPRVWLRQRYITASWRSVDSLSGIAQYKWVWDTLGIPASYTDSGFVGTAVSRRLSDGRLWMVHVMAMDSAGNASVRSDAGPFYIDSTPPTMPANITTVPLPGGWSRSDTITVFYAGQADAMSGVKGVAISWDTSRASFPSQVYYGQSSVSSGSLPDRRGYYVHLRTVDSAGNSSPVYSTGPFAIDAHAPAMPAITFSSMPATNWVNATIDTVRWRLASSDTAGLSNLLGYAWQWTANAASVPDTVITGISDSATKSMSEGTWYFHVRAADSAHNWSGAAHYGPIRVDRTPPTAVLTINNGAESTGDPHVTIRINAVDTLSGPLRALISDNGQSIGSMDFTGNTLAFPWDLSVTGGAGRHTVSARAVDRAGNWTAAFTASIIYEPTAVRNGIVADAFALRMFPNPAIAGETLQLAGMATAGARVHVLLFDVLGRIVIDQIVAATDAGATLALPAALAPGEYLCRVVSGASAASSIVTIVR